nr:hypothetical protein WG33_0032 [uncultured bacterium]
MMSAQSPQLLALARLFAQPPAMRAQVRSPRFDDNQAAAAIDREHVAVADLLQRCGGANHQWQVQAASQDRAVRQRAAAGGDHGHDPLSLQLRQFRRGNVVGDQDLAGHPGQAAAVAMQGRVDAADDLVDVVDAAAQVGVVHAVEHRGDAVALDPQCVVGGIAFAADQLVQAVQQLRIVEQQRVHVEEFADLLRQRTLQAPAQVAHLAAHDQDRRVQAGKFRIDILDPLLGDLQQSWQAQPGAAQDTAAGSTMRLQRSPHQPSSSNSRANRPAMASAASASSSPSTRSITGVPWPAASSITPMMLLALTSRPLAESVALLR